MGKKRSKYASEIASLVEKKHFGEIEEDIGFSSNVFMLFGLPNRKVKEAFWSRDNGPYKITISRNINHAVPYGTYARMNQIFIDTEITTKRSNEIDIGNTFNEYVKRLGYKEGRANKALLRQLLNYVTCSILFSPKNTAKNHFIGLQTFVGKAWNIWIDAKNPQQMTMDKGKLIIDPTYAGYVEKHAVPLDMNIVRVFKNNTLALDFYRFLAYRVNKLGRTLTIPDTDLKQQLGPSYSNKEIRKFRQRLKYILRAIQQYWKVRAKFEDGFFELKPSPLAIKGK